MERLRDWLGRTHGVRFELLRHFVQRFFDSEMSGDAEWRKVAIGIFAALVSISIVAYGTYLDRYELMRLAGLSLTQVLAELRADRLTFVGLAMAVTAALTILQWQSLFPSARDCMALAALPITPRQVFLAKAGALLLMFAAFVLSLTFMPSIAFASATSGLATFSQNFAMLAGGCIFVFFGLLALQGVMLNLLSGAAFERASTVVQGALFMAAIGGVPLVGRQPAQAWWWPPNWFVDGKVLLPTVLPIVVASAAYLTSYHRYRRLLLEGRTAASASRRATWDLPLSAPEQGVFAFIWKTLTRSRMHRLILLAYCGLGLGWIGKGAVDAGRPKLADQGMYGLMVTVAPLGIAMLIALGLRYLFALPVALPSNWLFQTTGQEGRRSWLAAVERFVVWCGILPVFVASLPATMAVLGPIRGAAVTLMTLLAALAFFERMYRDWRKLPFTCTYLPGKTPAWLLMLRAGVAAPLLGIGGTLMLRSSADLIPAIALLTFEAALWQRLRAVRLRTWEHTRLEFQERDEILMSLDLQPAAEIERSAPAPARDLFGGTMVASAGLLPESWREEIETDRRSIRTLAATFVEDLRYGARLIRRSPVFSAVVVLTLTVGIGINASVFTIVSAVAMRPHVSRDPASFVRIVPESRDRTTTRPVSYAEYTAWKREARSVRDLAAYTELMGVLGDEESNALTGAAVSCNFFRVDGLDRPLAGRLLTEEDCLHRGVVPPVVVSETVWRTRLGGSEAAIGRPVMFNSRPVIVVGVVPDRTAGWLVRPASVFMPYTAQTYFEPGRKAFESEDIFWLWMAGRMAPGYTRSRVKAEFNILARQQDAEHPGRRTAVLTTDGSWIEELYVSASGRELMLIGFFVGAFNLVLLVSCANVATLLLSRAATRRRELAVRLSLGAPRIRLVRMLVTESILLAAIAGVASAWLAYRVPGPLYHAVASKAPQFPMPPDWSTFGYIAGIVLVTGILSGLAPALESVRVDLAGTLKGAASILGGARLRGILVAAQVALSMVLLVEAALFARSEDQNLRGDPGYHPERVVVSWLRFPDNTTQEAAVTRLRTLEQRLTTLHGVHSVAFSNDLPLMWHETVELRPPARKDASQPVDVYGVSPRFLETMGVPMMGGRDFQETDGSALIVSQALARLFWPWKNPIGQTLSMADGPATIVGVARDVEPLRLGGSENPALYRLRRTDPAVNWMAVRFDSGVEAGAAAVRAAVHQTYPEMSPFVRQMQIWIREVTDTLWNVVALIVVLGAVATLLSTIGIYGAVSFAVNQRTRELGIRVALGATRLHIVRSVLVAGGKPVLHGLIAGLWLSVITAAGLRQSVEGSPLRLDTTNPLLYVAAAALLGIAALVAMIAPARRGAKADPLESLRCE
jgi:putative ABC transport system permease protein